MATSSVIAGNDVKLLGLGEKKRLQGNRVELRPVLITTGLFTSLLQGNKAESAATSTNNDRSLYLPVTG